MSINWLFQMFQTNGSLHLALFGFLLLFLSCHDCYLLRLITQPPCRLGLSFLFFSMWNREDMAFHKHTVLRLLGKEII